MKLVDILARELKVWPEGATYVDQSIVDYEVYAYDGSSNLKQTGLFLSRCADDPNTEITRAQWQAAVDALKAESSPAWVGIGLPPIGIDVEVFAGYSHPRFDRFIGQQVHIVAHDVINGDPVAVFRIPINGDDTEQDYHAMVAGSFRPLRTPKQVAEEELRKIIESGLDGKKTLTEVVSEILAAGYRKPTPTDN